MFPVTAAFDHPDCVSGNSKLTSDLRLAKSSSQQSEDLPHILFSKLSLTIKFARQHNTSAFGVHVIRVVLIGAKSKMFWATAGRIVTCMKHKQLVYDWAAEGYVGDTICF